MKGIRQIVMATNFILYSTLLNSYAQVIEYVNEHSIMPENQSSPHKKYSTQTPLLKVISLYPP